MSDYDVICKMREIDADDRHASAVEISHEILFDEFVDAFGTEKPTMLIGTPAYASHKVSTVADCMAMDDGDAELAMLVMKCAKHADPAIRILAQAWILRAAKDHADTHCHALAENRP